MDLRLVLLLVDSETVLGRIKRRERRNVSTAHKRPCQTSLKAETLWQTGHYND
ncbi:hypothetical protein KIN20_004801 [Parelaphostrongylus tenuis]|uniref:Uncharacterized protein n=1 Tax=Parelaphostrongylus tenuis TaxID=148309 RepID=A0AAD5MKB7_PARTN|nr:hypothetical protein KIN20_004801 [Parelaphostrongylus tenuis]